MLKLSVKKCSDVVLMVCVLQHINRKVYHKVNNTSCRAWIQKPSKTDVTTLHWAHPNKPL